MEKPSISTICRGTKGRLRKEAGVVIVKSDKYQDCSVEVNCPHYIKRATISQSQEYTANAGHCRKGNWRGEIDRCLFDRLDL
jgi:hypothetical protein